MIKWNSKVGVCDGGDEGGMFGRGWERAESVAVDGDVNREDGGDFYSGSKNCPHVCLFCIKSS